MTMAAGSAAPARTPPDVILYGALFAAAATAFCLGRMAAPQTGLTADLLAVAGDATCGWSWLLVRALFQPPAPRRALWPPALVLFLVAAGAVMRLAGDSPEPVLRVIDNLSGLVSSALLLLAAIEPLKGLDARTPRHERIFRIAFVAGYSAILAVAVIWVNGAPAGAFADTHRSGVKAACAALAVAGMGYAIWRRRRHPLSAAASRARRAAAPDEVELGARLSQLMAQEAVFTDPDLTAPKLARRLGEAEYRVTRAITGALGFANFNQMAHAVRIEEAKRRLSAPAFDHLPILTIAYDCGFRSIGPFNRAFKVRTGMTPMAFREDRKNNLEQN